MPIFETLSFLGSGKIDALGLLANLLVNPCTERENPNPYSDTLSIEATNHAAHRVVSEIGLKDLLGPVDDERYW